MLSDLDELILSCEDPRSRQYIEEAVRCYKAGAYRSSVVACWIAVAFDLVDKIKELAAGGDRRLRLKSLALKPFREPITYQELLHLRKNCLQWLEINLNSSLI
jgi:hypothetical protein